MKKSVIFSEQRIFKYILKIVHNRVIDFVCLIGIFILFFNKFKFTFHEIRILLNTSLETRLLHFLSQCLLQEK